MIKLLNLLKEIGEGSRPFTVTRGRKGHIIRFNITDPEFKITNFWIELIPCTKDNVLVHPAQEEGKIKVVVDKEAIDALLVGFGVNVGGDWTFPVLNTGQVYRIMTTVLRCVQAVLREYPEIRYLIYTSVERVRAIPSNIPQPRSKAGTIYGFEEEETESDQGVKRGNLYKAYIFSQIPTAEISIENGWTVAKLK